MAVVAVAADSARYDAMDATTNVTSIGGGAGSGVETDIIYQGTASISRKVTNAGFYSSTGANRNMATTGRRTWLAKVWLTNYSSLASTGNKLEVRIGSGTGAYYSYVVGSPTVDYPAKGGWAILAIDPNIATHRDGTTGSPTLTACNYFACFATCSTSKVENLCLDAIDVGYGLHLTGGDGGDPDGDFADFTADDEGDITGGRFGYVTTQSGVQFVFGRLVIGATSSSGVFTAVATGFTDSAAQVVWGENKGAAGFSGVVFHLGNASTLINLTRCNLNSRGTIAGEDTRAVLDVVGTSGLLTITGGAVSNFASLTLTSAATLDGVVISQCGQITAAGANLNNSSVQNSPATSALLWNVATDTDGLLDDMRFVSAGTGHAIELGASTPSSITLSGHDYSGYAVVNGTTGNEVIYNNSGKSITINISGGATPTIRNGTGASTILLLQAVTTQITVVDLVTSLPVENARVVVAASSGTGPLPYEDSVTIVRSGTTATVTHIGHGLTSGNNILIKGANELEYNGIKSVTVVNGDSYTYTVSGSPATPATGTILATGVVISGITDVNGQISDTRPYSTNQPITGKVRRATSGTLYRTGVVSGIIDNNSGFSATIQLQVDQ